LSVKSVTLTAPDIDKSLLDCLLDSRVPVGSGCKAGECGKCEVELVRGIVKNARGELIEAGIEGNASGCWIKSCQVCPVGDVSVLVEANRMVRSPAKIDSMEWIENSLCRLIVRVPSTANVSFIPGQYFELSLPAGVSRSYSPASSAEEKGRLEFLIRMRPSGVFSEYLKNRASINDMLFLSGPFGIRALNEVNQSRNHDIFMVTGTGVAPVTSMLRTFGRRYDGSASKATIFYGYRRGGFVPSELVNTRGVKVVLAASSEVSGGSPRIQDLFLKQGGADDTMRVFAAGSAAMVADVESMLCDHKFDLRYFYRDVFASSE